MTGEQTTTTITLAQSLSTVREMQQQGRFEDARRLSYAILDVVPKQPDALQLAALSENLCGRPDLALPLLQRLLTLDPNNFRHHQVLGSILRGLGRDKEAALAYEKALALIAAMPPELDPLLVNRRSTHVYLQHRPLNHFRYRRSQSFDSLISSYLESGPFQSDDLARSYFLTDNVARTLARGVPGALAELGVWRGATAKLLKVMSPGRMLYLFDTFTGFADGDFQPDDPRRQLFKDTSLEVVKAHVGTDQVVYCPGHFPDSTATLSPDLRFALVHLDCDVYQPTMAGLHYFYPRLNAGGLLMIHDYHNDSWPEVSQAVDEFFADKPEAVVIVPDKAGTGVIVKV